MAGRPGQLVAPTLVRPLLPGGLTNKHSFVCWDALPEELAGQVEDAELVVLEQAPAVAADLVERVECVQAVVTSEDVYWEALVKHTSIRLATTACPRATLEEIARQVA